LPNALYYCETGNNGDRAWTGSRLCGSSARSRTGAAVAGLERDIGARLLIRTTRSVKLTHAGERYLADCRRILSEIAEAEANAAGSFAAPAGALTITAPVLFGRLYVLPILLDFLDKYPAMQVRLLLLDRVTHLVEEGIDVAIRIAHLPSSALTALRVGAIRQVVCGAPAYFVRAGVPQAPGDLAQHRVIGRDGIFGGSEWRFGRDDSIRVPISTRFICNTNDAVIEAVLRGWGISRFQSYQVAEPIAAGRLVPVLTDYEREPVPIHIVHAEGRESSARLRAFIDFTARRLREDPRLQIRTDGRPSA
jgi:DNA-binding transcriptional LysR family regulator